VGLTLDAKREGPPWPIETFIDLVCDGEDHGLLQPAAARFDCNPWYPAAHTAAMRAGWKILPGCVLGPCCSGKKVTNDEPCADPD
jgi:hypothetical protein